jgi:hypothetical protein
MKRRRLNGDKIDLIDFAFTILKAKSFADLGGVWRVEGGYTFYALDVFQPNKGVLVDTSPIPTVMNRLKKYPKLKFVHGNFGDTSHAREVGPVDAIFLFDVLLHQVDPDWDLVLDMYAPQARILVIYNQQWIGSATTRLLELGEEGYFHNVPHSRGEHPYDDLFKKLDEPHPQYHNRLWRNVHNIWQWGITDEALQSKIKTLGFKMQYYRNCGRFGELPNFENHAFVFSR